VGWMDVLHGPEAGTDGATSALAGAAPGPAPVHDSPLPQDDDERFNIGVGRTRDGKYLVLESASHTTTECQILEALGVDYIDESEVLTPADETHHVVKHPFKVPFVCGCRNLGEALRRISEGAAMIRTKGEAGTGDVVEAVKHMRTVNAEIRKASTMSDEEMYVMAKEIGAPFELLKETAKLKRLPVVNFAAGGIATPADAALMMQLGCDGVFVGSGIFKSGNAAKRAKAIVQAVTHFNDPKVLAEVSTDLGEPMVGLTVDKLTEEQKLAKRGW